MKKNMFLGFLPKNTIVDCSTKEHRFLPCPSSTPSVLGKKNKAEEDTISLAILEKEVSNTSWQPLNFLLLTDKKTVGENSIENSDSLKYVWSEFSKSLQF